MRPQPHAAATTSAGSRSIRRPVSVQAKLTVSAPGDSYEQEADRVANEVLSRPARPGPRAAAGAGPGAPAAVQTQPGAAAAGAPSAAPAGVAGVLRAAGQPLDAATRAFMEPRFGHDFSQVRVHTDPLAAQSAAAIGAAAYTVGQHIVFGAGQFAPVGGEGQRLLAHELTHVVQQNTASAAPGLVQRSPDPSRWTPARACRNNCCSPVPPSGPPT